MHGKNSVFTWEDGRKYEGDYEEDKRSGHGKWTYSDRKTYYIGGWKDGKQHGEGKMVVEDNTV
jgi:hypothetical protein